MDPAIRSVDSPHRAPVPSWVTVVGTVGLVVVVWWLLRDPAARSDSVPNDELDRWANEPYTRPGTVRGSNTLTDDEAEGGMALVHVVEPPL